MKPKFILITAIAVGMGINSVNAQIKQRSQVQKHRIRQGVRTGELTRAETANLVHGKKEIRQDIRLAKSDGKITPGERMIIRNEQKNESRKIYRKKHNNRNRS